MRIAGLLFLLAAPFWETKAPADWTDDELVTLLTASPWAQIAEAAAARGLNSSGGVQVYLATAAPMADAEQQRELRYKKKRPGPQTEDIMAEEYRAWLEDNRATQIVLAIRVVRGKDFDDAQMTRHMEEESIMRIGKKKFKMTGHFPPTMNDPYLRMAFPRAATEADKMIQFDLFVPGVTPPFRTVQFLVKDMMFKGKLEM